MRGIILTDSMQLLELADKPMIYYSLALLLGAQVRDVLLIATPENIPRFQQLLGGGAQWGMSLSYALQPTPFQLAQALIVGAEFIGGQPTALLFGNHIFHGGELPAILQNATTMKKGARVFSSHQPCERVPGLYFYDHTVTERMLQSKQSLDDLNQTYLEQGALKQATLSDAITWLEVDRDSLPHACATIENIEKRDRIKVGCPEEAAWRSGFIDDEQLCELANASQHGRYLRQLPESDQHD